MDKDTNIMSVKEYREKISSKSKRKGHPENDEQVALFKWASIMNKKTPALELLLAIPNGAFYGGHWSVANRMKAEGVQKGVPDIFLPVPMTYTDNAVVTSMYAGLWIEMKAGKNKPSVEQTWWMEKLDSMGYKVAVCYSCEEAIEVITDYLDLNSKEE